jgi:O-antigen/teichoic acid export membrane protein
MKALLARKGILSVVDQALVSGTSFTIAVMIGRLCSKEELGVYSLALSALMLIRGIQGELVSSPYTMYCGRHDGAALAAYTGSSLVHYLSLSALSMLCLTSAACVLALGVGPAEARSVAWILAGALPFLLFRDCLRQIGMAHLRVLAVLVLDGTVTVLQLGGLVMLWWFSHLTVAAAITVMGVACATAVLGWFLTAKQPLAFVKDRLASDWKYNWTFGRWALASFLIGSTTPVLMPWIVALSHGKAATGALAACITLINCAGMYVMGVANLLAPRAARAFLHGGPAELSRMLSRTALMFIATLGTFCVVVVLAGDRPATLVYGSRYTGVSTVLALLAVSMLVNSLSITAGNGLWAMDRPAANFAADVCTFAVTIGTVSFLVGPLGILGAVLATLAGNSTGAAVRILTLLRLLKDADSSRRLQPAARLPQAEACGYGEREPIVVEPSGV